MKKPSVWFSREGMGEAQQAGRAGLGLARCSDFSGECVGAAVEAACAMAREWSYKV